MRNELNNKESRFLDKPGDYLLEIEAAWPHVSEKGNDCAKLKCCGAQGEESGKLFFAILPRNRKSMEKFNHFLSGCGKAGMADMQDLVGARLCATLIETEWEGKKRLGVSMFFKDRSGGNGQAGASADRGQEGQGRDNRRIISIESFTDRVARFPFCDRSLVCSIEVVCQKPRAKTPLLHIGLRIVSGQYAGRCFHVEALADSCLSREFFESLDVLTSSGVHVAAEALKCRQVLVDVECKSAGMIYEKVIGFRPSSLAAIEEDGASAIAKGCVPSRPSSFLTLPFSEKITCVSIDVDSERGELR